MRFLIHIALSVVLTGTSMAGTVMVTNFPDEAHPLPPLTSLGHIPLGVESEVLLGAFPGRDDDDLLDKAKEGYEALLAEFVRFGAVRTMRQGSRREDGRFEIAERQVIPETGSALEGEEIFLLIHREEQNEFIVARFPGQTFQADTETGLEQELSLHLADAKVIVGHRAGSTLLATSPAPAVGSFATWIGGFPGITDEALRLTDADPDQDGQTNFLEYATGGDPSVPSQQGRCRLIEEYGSLWILFPRFVGLGTIDYQIESSADLNSSWEKYSLDELEWDSFPLDAEGPVLMRLRVQESPLSSQFFRLRVEPTEPVE
jgi:hypothetical protein